MGDDSDLIRIGVLVTLSSETVKMTEKEAKSSEQPTRNSLILTWRGDFSDVNGWKPLRLESTLQYLQHPLFRELRQDVQVFRWNVELGPVVGYHTLASGKLGWNGTELLLLVLNIISTALHTSLQSYCRVGHKSTEHIKA